MEFTAKQKSDFLRKLYVIDYLKFKRDFEDLAWKSGVNYTVLLEERIGVARTTVTNMKCAAKKSHLNKYMCEMFEDCEIKGVATKYIFNIICKTTDLNPDDYILKLKTEVVPEQKEETPAPETAQPILMPTTDLVPVINKFNEVLEKLDKVTDAISKLDEVVLAINKVGNVQMQMLEYTKTIMDYSQTCAQNLKTINASGSSGNTAFVKRR